MKKTDHPPLATTAAGTRTAPDIAGMKGAAQLSQNDSARIPAPSVARGIRVISPDDASREPETVSRLVFLGSGGARFVVFRQIRASGGIWLESGAPGC